MKSVGETMAIGRNFKEALQKALRSLETGRFGFGADGVAIAGTEGKKIGKTEIDHKLTTPNSQRIFYLRHALKEGMSIDTLYKLTKIDHWFLYQMKQLVDFEDELEGYYGELPEEVLKKAKAWGYSDIQLAKLTNVDESLVKKQRVSLGIKPVYKLVDTCPAEIYQSGPDDQGTPV